MEDVNNSGLIILLIIAVIFFILWAIYLIRFLCAKRSISNKNKKLFSLVKDKDEKDNRLWEQEGTVRKQDEVINGLKAELRAALNKIGAPAPAVEPEAIPVNGEEIDIDALPEPEPQTEVQDPAPASENWDEFSVHDPELEERMMMHELEDMVMSSKLFLNADATKDDVAALIKVERKRLDTLLKNNGESSVADFLGKYRLEEAIAKIREAKLDSKNKNKDTEGAEPKKEVTLDDIAKASGFSSVRTMNKASKLRYGMNIHELRKVIKI